MIEIGSDELNKLQHYFDYMYWYITILTAIYYLTFLSLGFMIKFLIIEVNKRISYLRHSKNRNDNELKF